MSRVEVAPTSELAPGERTIVDTDAPELREWAVTTFERFRSESRPAYEE